MTHPNKKQVTPENVEDLMRALRALARRGVVCAAYSGVTGQTQLSGRLTCEYRNHQPAPMVVCRFGRNYTPPIPVRARGYVPMRLGDYFACYEVNGNGAVCITYTSYGAERDTLQTFTLA